MLTATLAAFCVVGSQERIPPSEPRYESATGKFSIVLPEGFDSHPIEETGSEVNQIIGFSVNRAQTVFIKAFISRFENPKYLTIEKWSDNGRKSWLAHPGYKEEMYAPVNYKNGKAYVHIFRFHNVDQNNKPRDAFKMKSVRTMRGKIGYWFVFYSTPKFYDDYSPLFDKAVNSIKFLDE